MGQYLIHTDNGQELILEHHGILGQKWGVRRFQNPDGTLTAEGKARYQNLHGKELRKALDKAAFEKKKKNGWTMLNNTVSTGKNSDTAKAENYRRLKEYKDSLNADRTKYDKGYLEDLHKAGLFKEYDRLGDSYHIA